VDGDGVAAREISNVPLQLERIVLTGRPPRRAGRHAPLVDDRDPPQAAPARLPEIAGSGRISARASAATAGKQRRRTHDAGDDHGHDSRPDF
jgi:hypothetical protein